MLLATRPQVNRAVTVNSRLANRAVNRAFLQPALRWSSKCDAVEAVCMHIDGVVDALEHHRDTACENCDTRADAGILLRNVLSFNLYRAAWNADAV